MRKHTVCVQFAVAAVERLSAEARERVLPSSGIAREWLEVPHARIPASAFHALWLAVARELDDEFFGLDRRRMKCGSFALLCHSVLHSRTLGPALRRILRGFALILDDVRGELLVEGRRAVVRLDNRIEPAPARRFADETFLVMVHGLMCWLAGRRIPLLRADFAHPRPPHVAEYAVMFSPCLRFQAEHTRVEFDARLLDAPVVQDEPALKTFLRTAPQSVFLKYKNEDGWSARVRRELRCCIGSPSWPTLRATAGALHVSSTTLRRRLGAEGTSFQDIKDELRRDAAIHRLVASSQSIADIAAQVGFEETSAFHRAFKRWCGVRPGDYRKQAGAHPRA